MEATPIGYVCFELWAPSPQYCTDGEGPQSLLFFKSSKNQTVATHQMSRWWR